jgi:hypothetical protein
MQAEALTYVRWLLRPEDLIFQLLQILCQKCCSGSLALGRKRASYAVPDYAAKVQSLVLSGGQSQIERLDTDSVLWVWGNKWIAHWRDLPDNPRAAESEQVSYATYYSWMSDCNSQPAPYVDHRYCINPEPLADLMRLGAHWLNVVTGRWTNGGTERRTERYCRKCMAYAIEDEKQFLMECPAYQVSSPG